MSFATEEKVWYKRNKEAEPEREQSSFYKKDRTQLYYRKKGRHILAHANQFRARFKPAEEENETTKHGLKRE